MVSVVPAGQLGGRRSAEGISVDSDKMMTSCMGWFNFTNFFGFVFSPPEILKKKKIKKQPRIPQKVLPGGDRTSARSRWLCSPDGTGRAPE